ncbi:thioredoxin domain-containing protein [Brachybacterium sp. YJGR34]|uniref:DsbA family protein n=1 Tax=Brachybacterium sp. YJGR34 TaxID=2059911 RepID=UPI000E0C7F9C|nr:thioredoxin domain-containing protein [Brachybacterium sp. YJGR34]
MAASGSSQSAQERREAQREALRQQRHAELKRQRSVRTVVIAAITVVALVIAGGIGFLIYRSAQPEGPVAVPEGMSADQPYLSLGAPEDSGAPVLEVHLDFMCPYCGQFEDINGADLEQLVADEEATVHLVPRRFLDTQSSSGDYSSRAAAAMVCVYEDDPANVLPFQQLMFENQPAEGSAGLDDEQIWGYAQEAGASDAVESCMSDGTYERWVKEVSDPYGEENGGGTPYVEIDGTEFQDWATEGALAQAVRDAGEGSAASDAGEG